MTTNEQSELDGAKVLKEKSEALGILRRAGVDAESAAAKVGLEGLSFIPGNPITIRSDDG